MRRQPSGSVATIDLSPSRESNAMTINESLDGVLKEKESLANLFYFTIFFDEYPEVRPYFDKVNMRHQVVLLTMALMVMVNHYVNKYSATEMYLRYLGTKHKDRGIPVDLYPKFRSAL